MIKWIGQHIVDFIARFRSDVYLEDIADGTVVDNKFLGLDSNNKIVKEAASATVTDLHSAGVDGSANQLLTDNGDGTIQSESTFKYDLDLRTLHLQGYFANAPQVELKNSNTDPTYKSTVRFVKDASNVEDGEHLGAVDWYGDNDAGTPEQINYSKILSTIADMTDGQEAGNMYLQVASYDGVLTNGIQLLGDTNADGEVDVTIGAGAASTTTVAGDLSVTTGLILDSVDITTIQTAAESFADNDTSLMTSAAIDDRINAASSGLSYDGSTANGLLTYKDADEITVESNAKYDDSFGLILTSGTSAKPELTIQNSNTDAVGSILKFEKTATGTNSDKIGKIQFQAADNADASITFAEIEGSIYNATSAASAQAGQLQLQIRQAGSLANVLKANTLGVGTLLEFADGGALSYTTFKSAIVNFESALPTAPIFSLTNETDDANGPQLMFIKDRGNVAGAGSTDDGDELGRLTFRGRDSGGGSTDYAEFYGSAVETDATNECGKAQLLVMADGQSTLRNAITGTGHTTVDKVDIDLGYGTASTTTVAGDLTVSGGDITIGTTAGEIVSTGQHILKQTKVTIDTAGFNGLNSTPVELVAAQGANKVIVPTEVILFHDRAATNTNATDLIVGFNGLTSFWTAVKYIRRYMQNVSTDRTMDMGRYAGNWANDLTTAVNSNLTIALSAAPTTNCVTSLTVYTSYYVIDIS